MSILVVGSRALNFYFPHSRPARDWDVIIDNGIVPKTFENCVSVKETPHFTQYRGNIFGSTAEIKFLKDSNTSSGWMLQRFAGYAPPDVLMTIKKSHLYWNLRWEKHLGDYHFLKREGAKIIPELFKMRFEETQERLGPLKKPNINCSNEMFFDQSAKALKRKFVHDDLHRWTCYYDIPLFEKVKNNKAIANIDYALWHQLSHEDKVRLAREEGFAIALERFVIPKEDWGANRRNVLFKAMKIVALRLTGMGKFKEFIIDNFYEIVNSDVDFITKFKTNLEKESSNVCI